MDFRDEGCGTRPSLPLVAEFGGLAALTFEWALASISQERPWEV